jgi:hypothetical protein
MRLCRLWMASQLLLSYAPNFPTNAPQAYHHGSGATASTPQPGINSYGPGAFFTLFRTTSGLAEGAHRSVRNRNLATTIKNFMLHGRVASPGDTESGLVSNAAPLANSWASSSDLTLDENDDTSHLEMRWPPRGDSRISIPLGWVAASAGAVITYPPRVYAPLGSLRHGNSQGIVKRNGSGEKFGYKEVMGPVFVKELKYVDQDEVSGKEIEMKDLR